MKRQRTPKISFIIPTYNEEKNVKKWLDSIFKQHSPHIKIEVVLVDNYSKDDTLKIAKNYPIKILMNKIKHGEVSKMIGFRASTGKYAIYLDADVELIGKKWIQKMIKPLEEDENIIGTFTRKYSRKSDPALERFYSFDPLQRDSIYQLFSPSIDSTIQSKKKGYYLLKYEQHRIPPAGRCLYRRESLLYLTKAYDMFLELDFLVLLTRKGYKYFGYVPSAGLYHHHSPDLKTLLRKRRYNVQNVYLKTFNQKKYKWFDLSNTRDISKIILWTLYANLVFPSIIVGAYKSLKFKDWAGLYEPIVNLLVTDTIILSFISSTSFH